MRMEAELNSPRNIITGSDKSENALNNGWASESSVDADRTGTESRVLTGHSVVGLRLNGKVGDTRRKPWLRRN